MKLGYRIVSVTDLDASMRESMWRVFARYYDGVRYDRFERDLSTKTDAILLLDESDQVVGFSTIEVIRTAPSGRDVIVVYTGDTIVERKYWGQTALQNGFARFIVALKLGNPTTPVYWFLISKGYKTYLLLSRNFVDYWPRHDAELPVSEKALVDRLASDKFAEAYDPERGILLMQGRDGFLKPGIAPIDQKLLDAPDVRFFNERNPTHEQGDELCCLGVVDFKFMAAFVAKRVRRTLKKGSEGMLLLPWRTRTR